MATNLYIIDFMMWEEYIRQWANKKIEIPELRLSESLKAELVKTLLLVFPRPYEEHTYEEAAEITNNQPCLRTMKNHMNKIYETCFFTDPRITKNLLFKELNRGFSENYRTIELSNSPSPSTENLLESPEGVVPIGSPFYMEPASVLEECQEEITQPQALLRIQAPRQRGKTSLSERIIQYANSLDYRVARVDLRGADSATLKNFNSLLQWICQQVCKQLELSIDVTEHWGTGVRDSKSTCTNFFEDYLLKPVDPPLLLSLDNLEEVFADRLVGEDICNLLRSWKEQRSKPWQNMRMVILHTGHINDGINNSSLQNVGSLITLPELTIEQVTKLVELYDLKWDDRQIESLVDLVGGDPSLIRLVLDRIAKGMTSLEDVLEGGHLPGGLFKQHLARQWRFLQNSPDLCTIVQRVLREENPEIPTGNFLEQLRECGIIKADGTRTILANRLYKLFLKIQLPVDKT